MTGNLLLSGGLTAALATMVICFAQKIPSARLVKICAGTSTSFICAASLFLWYLLFENDFSVEYVATYSSTTLSTVYKISAFWAGQQGSFLLWLLIHAITGAILTFRRTSAAALGIFFLMQSVLTFLVLAKSPFAENPAQVYEGVGLNPLLQDFWMAIHPPIIFAGYALLAVPFALSLGNLLTEASQAWLEEARKWTLLAWSLLGAGIFIGGYWAYKVLGWGGYWGWDPVENSSLVPYLLAAVLLHLITLARKKPAVLAVTHLAATFTYSLVIYGTFLTRSGILGDFSVHSFAGSNIGLAIALANALVLIGGLSIILIKAKSLPQGKMYETHGESAFIILLSCLLLIFIAVIVWIGMSMPLLSQLFGQASAVDTDFYVRTTAPIALTVAALMIYAFAKFGRMISFGGKIAHVGFLAMLTAIIISVQGETVTQELRPREKISIAGHEVIYEGQVFFEAEHKKFYVYTVDGEAVRALTKLRGNGGEDAAREPAILKNFSGDIYIAPHASAIDDVQELLLTKNLFTMDGELGYVFEDAHIERDENNQPTQATAQITITDGEVEEVIHPLIIVTPDGGSSQALEVFNGKRRVRLTGISGDLQKARLEILPTLEKLSSMPVTATISTKPFIWLLWLSVTAICAGTLLAIKKF